LDDQTKFVIVGKKAWGYSEIKNLIAGNSSVRMLGYLNDGQITALYRYAKAFVYPSIYEGFGSPLIEAMSQGVPIIISNIPTSVELNENHNNQMFRFDLGDQEGLIYLFQKIDSEFNAIHSRLYYGDLSVYRYETVASLHLEIYLKSLHAS
ncbi:MAG TPA: glycosyltransferase, partial [Bacteroidota bacterium]|nr:glycosyltransferase [Bacteroidota bacterium]